MMFNYIQGKLVYQEWKYLIVNDKIGIGVEVLYEWLKNVNQECAFFLYNIIDDKSKTISYFAFDNMKQKILFEKLYKINGVGVKSAYHISFCNIDTLDRAIKDIDVNFFEQIQWIGPKTAKKILLELKLDIWKKDISKLNTDKKILNQSIKYFWSLWYNEWQVKSILQKYDWEFSSDNMSDIYKYIIDNISRR